MSAWWLVFFATILAAAALTAGAVRYGVRRARGRPEWPTAANDNRRQSRRRAG